jgi:2-amino-4-hydroxy-6-hydroxymethyldihydropteridine diphosphokinase
MELSQDNCVRGKDRDRSAVEERAAIALGSNLGDSANLLKMALAALSREEGIVLAHVSPLYQTVPVGPPQPDFLNTCAILHTTLSPSELLSRLLQVEQQFGRVRREHWGPRSLDLDLLLYGDRIIEQPDLQVPHPRMRDRAFVLVPLADIASDWVEPITQQTVASLLRRIDPVGVRPISSLA